MLPSGAASSVCFQIGIGDYTSPAKFSTVSGARSAPDSSRKEEGFVSCTIKDILGGHSPGHQEQGLLKRIAQAKTDKERDSMTAYYNCMGAAKHWQLAAMSSQPTSQLITDYRLLSDEGYADDLPVMNKLLYTKKFGEERFAESKFKEWAEMTMLLSEDETDWDVVDPCFAAFDMEEPSEELLAEFNKSWCATVLSDEWLSKFMHALESVVQRRAFQSSIQIFLGMHLPAQGKLSEQMKELASPIIKIMRGLLALLNPEPYPLGASTADVDFLSQSKARAKDKMLLLDTPHVDQSTLKCIQRNLTRGRAEGGAWAALLTQYEKVVGAEASHGRELLDLKHKMLEVDEESRADPPLLSEVKLLAKQEDLVNKCAKQLPELAKYLREGATHQIEETVLCWTEKLLHVYQDANQGGKGEVFEARYQLLMACNECLAVMTCDQAAAVRHKMNDTVMAATEASMLMSLEVAVLKSFVSMPEVVGLAKAVRRASNLTKPGELLMYLTDAGELAMKRVCKFIADSVKGDDGWNSLPVALEDIEEGVKVVKLILKEKGTGPTTDEAQRKEWRENWTRWTEVIQKIVCFVRDRKAFEDHFAGVGDKKDVYGLFEVAASIAGVRGFAKDHGLVDALGMMMDAMMKDISPKLNDAFGGLQPHVMKRISYITESMAKTYTKLSGMASGGQGQSDGVAASWYDGWAAPVDGQLTRKQVIDFCEGTLCKVAVETVGETLDCMVALLGDMSEALAWLSPAGFVINLPDDHEKSMDKYRQCCRRAFITKLEYMLVRCFQKPGWKADKIKKQLTKTLKDVPTECVTALGDQYGIVPKRDIMPAMWHIVDEATQ